jgi:hypothetical protein
MACSLDVSLLWRRGRGPLLMLAAALTVRADPSFFLTRVAPVFEQHCVGCHGAEKDKGRLRLDAYEHLMAGGESGQVIKPGDAAGSELFWRITLPAGHEYVMPSDGKPLLSADEIKLVELWITAGASATTPVSGFPDAPAARPIQPAVPWAPDWRPLTAEIDRLQRELGLKLVPRSQNVTDGLVLRTASAPRRFDDGTLIALAPVAALIVDAELARTHVTDAGLRTLAGFQNLRALDLSRTRVTSDGVAALMTLPALEVLNLTDTAVDEEGLARLKALPALKQVWHFGTAASP